MDIQEIFENAIIEFSSVEIAEDEDRLNIPLIQKLESAPKIIEHGTVKAHNKESIPQSDNIITLSERGDSQDYIFGRLKLESAPKVNLQFSNQYTDDNLNSGSDNINTSNIRGDSQDYIFGRLKREKAIWENIIEIGNRLIEVKNALPHGSFESWCELEFKWTIRTAQKYMKVSKELKTKNPSLLNLETNFEPLYVLASALGKADEETKEEILTAVEEKTEKKGKLHI